MTTRRPTIGVFDSGFGGLTVLKALLELIPDADYLYFGDTARLPYGSKSVETVARYAVEAAHYLEAHGAELLVIACNTATALALDRITAAAHVPVVGVVEPGAEAAASVSKNKKVVVIGTEATVSSHAYRKALEARGLDAREKACPLLVPLVEEGWVEHPVTEQVARIYLGEAFADGLRRRGRSGARLHSLSAAQADAASRGAAACEHCRLRRIHRPRRRRSSARSSYRSRGPSTRKDGRGRVSSSSPPTRWKNSGAWATASWAIPSKTFSTWT